MGKRVYKFLSADHALDDLRRRRLKISTIDDLNDPFDLRAVATTDPAIKKALAETIRETWENKGLLCFSRNWDNILLWSHYGCRHTGLCLGFDISDTQPDSEYGADVSYQSSFLPAHSLKDVNEAFALKLIRTKHLSWSYEQEVRVFFQLDDPPDEKGMNWADFGEGLNLKEVIVGAQCSPEDVREVAQVQQRYSDKVEFSWVYLKKDAFSLLRMTSPPPRLA